MGILLPRVYVLKRERPTPASYLIHNRQCRRTIVADSGKVPTVDLTVAVRLERTSSLAWVLDGLSCISRTSLTLVLHCRSGNDHVMPCQRRENGCGLLGSRYSTRLSVLRVVSCRKLLGGSRFGAGVACSFSRQESRLI